MAFIGFWVLKFRRNKSGGNVEGLRPLARHRRRHPQKFRATTPRGALHLETLAKLLVSGPEGQPPEGFGGA
jgi:hypothetical protein